MKQGLRATEGPNDHIAASQRPIEGRQNISMPKNESTSPRYVPADTVTGYCLKITLQEIQPPIWRRIQVLGSIKLCCLHSAFQVAMGWTDSHLHQFDKDGKSWGVPEYDEFDELELIDEARPTLPTCSTLRVTQ